MLCIEIGFSTYELWNYKVYVTENDCTFTINRTDDDITKQAKKTNTKTSCIVMYLLYEYATRA